MTWKENFAIGIPEIDRQHKQLCDKIDELFAACSQGKGTDECLKTINFLESYTIRHFADEEKLQQKINYPKFQQHKALHTAFAKQVATLKKDATEKGLTIPAVININNIISSWLINHIMKEDKQLQAFVNKAS